MTSLKTPLHGRTHLPWGSDPIPRLGDTRIPWVLFRAGLTTQTITQDTDEYFDISGLLVSPLNDGGTID